MKKLIKNLSVSFIANIISLVISSIITIVAPKFISETHYGYYQLYLFYIVYIAYLHFGLVDGIILRKGGKEYKELDFGVYKRQFLFYCIAQFVFSLVIIGAAFAFLNEIERFIVVVCVGICVIFYLPRIYFQGIFQATNRIKEYSIQVILEKIIMILFVLISILLKHYSFIYFVVGDMVGKVASLIYCLFVSKDIILDKSSVSVENVKTEVKENLRVGWKMTLSLIAGNVIIGIVRFAIEKQWDVETFGKVSLTLTISNLFMVAVRSITVVMFPALRRTNPNNYGKIYQAFDKILYVTIFFLISFFYILEFLIIKILPKYSDSLAFMSILFPLCYFESKMALLIETYMKTMRKENSLLLVNIITVVFSFGFTLIFVLWLKNLYLAILSILILCMIRCIIGEIIVTKCLSISFISTIIFEVVLTIAFVLINYYFEGWIRLWLYIASFIVVMLFRFKSLKKSILDLKTNVVSDNKE